MELGLWLTFSIALILGVYYQVTNFAWTLIFYTICMSCLTAYSRNVDVYKRQEEEQELIQLRKKVKQLEMENDILKQAALILGRR